VEPTSQRARAGRPLRTLVLIWQDRSCVSLAAQHIAREGGPPSSKVLAIGDDRCLIQARFRISKLGDRAFTLSLLASQSCEVRPRYSSKCLGLRPWNSEAAFFATALQPCPYRSGAGRFHVDPASPLTHLPCTRPCEPHTNLHPNFISPLGRRLYTAPYSIALSSTLRLLHRSASPFRRLCNQTLRHGLNCSRRPLRYGRRLGIDGLWHVAAH
jgi:hypothetical protein